MNCEWEWTFMQTMDHTRKHLGTLCRNTRNTLGCIFPCFQCLGRKIMQKMHPQSSDAILVHMCTPHDVISVKTMPPSGRAQPQIHLVQI